MTRLAAALRLARCSPLRPIRRSPGAGDGGDGARRHAGVPRSARRRRARRRLSDDAALLFAARPSGCRATARSARGSTPRWPARSRRRRGRRGISFVFVPGWLYRTNPESGADFARPRRVLGCTRLCGPAGRDRRERHRGGERRRARGRARAAGRRRAPARSRSARARRGRRRSSPSTGSTARARPLTSPHG